MLPLLQLQTVTTALTGTSFSVTHNHAHTPAHFTHI